MVYLVYMPQVGGGGMWLSPHWCPNMGTPVYMGERTGLIFTALGPVWGRIQSHFGGAKFPSGRKSVLCGMKLIISSCIINIDEVGISQFLDPTGISILIEAVFGGDTTGKPDILFPGRFHTHAKV